MAVGGALGMAGTGSIRKRPQTLISIRGQCLRLFGRIIDRLTRNDAHPAAHPWGDLLPWLIAWAAFGIFSILAGVLVALHADRLSHRRRLAVMADYFDHVLKLPLSFHSANHSGRLLKIMLEGAQGMAGLWLSFFRENCASAVALFILLPLTLFVNWRLASVLIVLVAVFGSLTIYVVRQTEALQGTVERHSAELAEHTSDAFGNISVVQSFTRVSVESRAMRRITSQLLAAQLPVLSWWALVTVATRASATLSSSSGVFQHYRPVADWQLSSAEARSRPYCIGFGSMPGARTASAKRVSGKP
jgi:ATP-binding cassette, subfamily B, beta-glucan exporter